MPASDEEAPKVTRAKENTPLLPGACVGSEDISRLKAKAQSESVSRTCANFLAQSETRRFLLMVVLSAMLISIGVVAGMKLEGWRFVTSLYFIAQVVTTIGYGDLTPTNDVTKVCCAMYILCSLVVLAYAFNIIAQRLARMQTNFIRKRLRVLEAVVFRHASADDWKDETQLDQLHTKMKDMYGRFNKMVAATVFVVFFVLFGTVFYRLYEACTCSYGSHRVRGCLMTSHEVCARTGGYVHTWSSAFYMSVVTLTTVGFGDHTPKTQLGRAVAVFWMMFGVASMANWVAKLSAFFITEQLRRDDFIREEINEQTFNSMDRDGDGYLSRSEYRSYVLVRFGLVTQGELDAIDKHYNMLDQSRTECVTFAMVRQAQESSKANTEDFSP